MESLGTYENPLYTFDSVLPPWHDASCLIVSTLTDVDYFIKQFHDAIGNPYLIKRTAKRASKQAGYFPFDINGFNLRATYQSVYCGKVKKWKRNNYLKLSSENFQNFILVCLVRHWSLLTRKVAETLITDILFLSFAHSQVPQLMLAHIAHIQIHCINAQWTSNSVIELARKVSERTICAVSRWNNRREFYQLLPRWTVRNKRELCYVRTLDRSFTRVMRAWYPSGSRIIMFSII